MGSRLSAFRSLGGFFIAMFVLFLAGCAAPVNMLTTLDESTVLNEGEGIVVARIINAGSVSLPFNQLTLTPENLNESAEVKPERLLAKYPATGGSTVFSSPVPAGSYALRNVRAFYTNGDRWYSRYVSSDATFGTFEVRPGQITDLGTLIYYPKTQEDRYVDTLVRLPDSASGEVLEKYFSFYNFDKNALQTWLVDGSEEDSLAEFASMVQNPVVFDKRYLAPNGSLYFLGRLGAIIERTADGDWLLDAVDTNLDLTAIAANEAGDLVVGGVEGRLFKKSPGGEWQDISLDYRQQIAGIKLSDDGVLDVVTFHNTDVHINRANITGDISWQRLDSYNFIAGWSSAPPVPDEEKSSATKKPRPKRVDGVRVYRLGDEDFLSVRMSPLSQESIFAASTTKVFRFDTATWSISEPTEDPEFSNVIDLGAVKLAIKLPGFWSWSPKPDYFLQTADGSWQEIVTSVRKCRDGSFTKEATCVSESGAEFKSRKSGFNFKTVPWFKNANEGVALVSFWRSGKSETKMLATSDGGQSWQDTGFSTPEKYCSQFVHQITDRILLSCDGATGDFYESMDSGETWQHVRQHGNF